MLRYLHTQYVQIAYLGLPCTTIYCENAIYCNARIFFFDKIYNTKRRAFLLVRLGATNLAITIRVS